MTSFPSEVATHLGRRRPIERGGWRVEKRSGVGILVGHGALMMGWWSWFFAGYPGVAETARALRS